MQTKKLLPLLPLALATSCAKVEEPRPNILWVMLEDWSTDAGCYGTKGVHTPNIDKLASEGILYTNAYTTAPVSSASRSAMMTGYYQNFVHGNQHRLASEDKQPLPEGVVPVPHLMKANGYYTQLMHYKTDCNYTPFAPADLFEDTRYWDKRNPEEPFFTGGNTQRKEGQPFFARMTFHGTHRTWKRDPERPIATEDVELPPYYYDNDFVRRDWANGLEQLQLCDRELGELMEQIDKEGLRENTIVIFLADNGRCHIRGKQFLYEPGVKVPMIIRWPGKIKPGQRSDVMVNTLDIVKTVIDLAGAKTQIPLHGMNLFGNEINEREYLFFARDRMDETHDAMRSVRSKDGLKLIHNLMPERPYLQYNQYKETSYPVLAEMNYLYLTGQLNEVQARFFAATKPEYELYDLNNDPYEINNLADDAEYAAQKATLLAALNDWRTNTIHDQGVSDDFRALNIYPEQCPEVSTDAFIAKTYGQYDVKRYGWPAFYPTRSAEEWKTIRDLWKEYIYRDASVPPVRPPFSELSKRMKKNKKKK